MTPELTAMYSGAASDPRLKELVEVGLPDRWLRIAGVVGYDAFMRLWAILDEENLGADYGERSQVRLWIPQISNYFRYQRNRFIEALDQAGYTSSEIKSRVEREVGAQISLRTVERIVAQHRRS